MTIHAKKRAVLVQGGAEVEAFGDVFHLITAKDELLVCAHQRHLDQEDEEGHREWEGHLCDEHAFDRDPTHGQLKNEDSAHEETAK